MKDKQVSSMGKKEKKIKLEVTADELKRIYDAICFVDSINQVSIIANGLNNKNLLLDYNLKKKILKIKTN